MSKTASILNGIRLGIALTDFILAIRDFVQGRTLWGVVLLIVGVVLLLQSIRAMKPRPYKEVVVHSLDELPEEEADEILKIIGGSGIMTKREAQELRDRVETLEQENADLRKQNEELKKMIKEQSDDQDDKR